jgi:hypothetical protein
LDKVYIKLKKRRNNMKGFIRNNTPVWVHALKRTVGPNQMVQLDDLYEQYGKKHGLSEGKEFVGWLRSVKLRDENKWQIVLEEDNFDDNKRVEVKTEDECEDTNSEVKESDVELQFTKVKGGGLVNPTNTKDLSVKDVTSLSVRKAREIIPTITDVKLLKYALQEARQLSNKDSLCIILRKRIKEIEVSR